MVRRLFLHIGAHKTGTTALQLGLFHNRAVLETKGVSYVSAKSEAHVHSVLGWVSQTGPVPDGLCVADMAGLTELLGRATQDVVIASSENFSFFFRQEPIDALAQALRAQFDDIRIVSYLRRQDRHAVSHHQEGAKPFRHTENALWGQSPTALPEVLPHQALYLDYDSRLRLWTNAFGTDKLIPRVYDRAKMKDGDIFADFLSLMGIGTADMKEIGDRNPSLTAEQARIGHLMLGVGAKGELVRHVQEQTSGQGRLLPTRDAARAFLEPYRTGNRRLNETYRISSDPDLFSDDFSDLPETPDDCWSNEGATSAFLAALTHAMTLSGDVMSADDFRLAAQALKGKDPALAMKFVRQAERLRPKGPAILKLKSELEELLRKPA